MEIAKRTVLIVFIFISNVGFSQNIKWFHTNNLLIRQLVDIDNKDTIKIFNISSIYNDEERVYKTQTISLQYLNDSILYYDFEKFSNDGSEITKFLSDSCINKQNVPTSEVNNFLGGIFLDVINRCQSSFNSLNKSDAKIYSKILQQLLLVVDNKKLDFLIDYSTAINLDLISIENLFLQAKRENDLRKLFILAQSYMMNDYDDISHLDFTTTRLVFSYTYEFHDVNKLFKKQDLRKLKKLTPKSVKIQSLNADCWVQKIPQHLLRN